MPTRTTVATAALAVLASVVFVDRAVVSSVAAQDRVSTLVAQVRTALGGDAALAAVKALSLEGPYTRVVGTRSRDSVVSLLIVRPDQLRRAEESRFFTTIERVTTFDGTQVWDDAVESSAGVGGGHGGGFDHGGGGHAPEAGAAGEHGAWDHDDHSDADSQADAGDASGALSAEQLAAARVRRMKMDLQRWSVAFLADSARPFTVAARVESPDGPADMLETSDEAGRPVRYVIDATSHRPLMVQYQQARVAAPGSRPRPAPATTVTTLATVAMRLSGYRKVEGVLMPHQIDIAIDGRASEAWTIDTIRINPKVKPGTFKKPTK